MSERPTNWKWTRLTLLPYDGYEAHRYNDLIAKGESWGHCGIEARIGERILDVRLAPSGVVILSEHTSGSERPV